MRARTGLWEPRVGNDPRRPGPTRAVSLALARIIASSAAEDATYLKWGGIVHREMPIQDPRRSRTDDAARSKAAAIAHPGGSAAELGGDFVPRSEMSCRKSGRSRRALRSESSFISAASRKPAA